MATDRMTELAAISAVPPAAPPAAFAVTDEVWAAVRDFHTHLHRLCGLCGQSINIVSCDDVEFRYSAAQLDGLVLAHLVQRHGWTRESIGDT